MFRSNPFWKFQICFAPEGGAGAGNDTVVSGGNRYLLAIVNGGANSIASSRHQHPFLACTMRGKKIVVLVNRTKETPSSGSHMGHKVRAVICRAMDLNAEV